MNNSEFKTELAQLINRASAENGSDTPDFILAEYLNNCLQIFDSAVRARDNWREPNIKVVSSDSSINSSTINLDNGVKIINPRPSAVEINKL